MANLDAPRGLTPIRHRNGAPYTGSGNPYYAASDYATALYVGDPVVRVTGGSNDAAIKTPDGDFPIGTLGEVEKATVGANAITGVIVAFGPLPNALGTQYNTASTERVVYVEDDPDVIFEIQCEAALSADQVGLNAVLIYTNSGSTVTGRSGAEMDGGTTTAPAADATYQLTFLRAVNKPNNDVTLTNCDVEVKINVHTEAHGVVGI